MPLTSRITGIGSLPHEDPAEAMAFVAATCPEVPYWPQLPRLGPQEGMIGQALAPASPPPGLEALVRSLREDPWPRLEAVKGQVTGPITLAWALAREGTEVEDAAALIEARIVEQIEALRVARKPILIFLDEPCLPFALEAAPDHEAVLAPLQRCLRFLEDRGARSGVHCCARPPLAALTALRPSLLSFDALSGIEGFFADAAAPALLDAGIGLALGIAPSRREEIDQSPDALAARIAAAAGPSLARWRGHAFLTPACGLAGLTEDQARRSFALAREVGARLERA